MNKKLTTAVIAALCTVALMAGCASQSEAVYDYDLSEYVVLGQYKGVEVTEEDIVVTDEEVQEEIQERTLAAGEPAEVKSGFVEYGDTANIDYEGKKDGVAFAGGTAQGYDLVIGSGQFIPGFEDGLIGKRIGDTVVLDLTFPESYQSQDLAGKEVEFTVKINFVSRQTPKKYDLAFVEENSEFESMEEYENSVKEDLQRNKEEEASLKKEQDVWQKIVDDSEILKYPEKELKDFVDQTTDYYKQYAQAYQMSWEDFLSGQIEMTEEEFQTELTAYAESQIGQEMIICSIAREEGIEISEEEYAEGIQEFLKSQGYESEQDFKNANNGQSLEQVMGRKNIEISLLAEKVLTFVTDEAVVTQ